MGLLAEKLYVFLDVSNEAEVSFGTKYFIEAPADETDAKLKWAEALKEGIKDMLMASNATGLGKAGLGGVDDAVDVGLTDLQYAPTNLWISGLDTTMDLIKTNIQSNSSQNPVALAGNTITVVGPTAPFSAKTNVPFYDEGINLTTGMPVTGFELANSLEQWISTWLMTGTYTIMNNASGIALGPFPWGAAGEIPPGDEDGDGVPDPDDADPEDPDVQ